ncbi:heme ABC transporter ATP-binding protein [Okibacterium endophyticum]
MTFTATQSILPVRLDRGSPAIEASGLSVAIDGKTILDRACLRVSAGELVALIGPNGAGKSTLLSAITGDQALSSGSVLIAGRELAEWSLKDLARRRSVLPQENGVFFPFTVREVVEMGRAPWRRTPLEDEDDEAVTDAMSVTDMERFGGRQVPSLSGGERARSSFARVLAQRTGILLLDEPTAALDLRHQEDVLRLAHDRARQGDAVVVVLHDLNLAAAYADTIVLVHRGRIVSAGRPGEVLTAARITEVYEQPVEIFTHPRSGAPLIVPVRDALEPGIQRKA